MSIYLNENFDGVTPPALPSGWSVTGGSGFAVATSSAFSFSGANSLKYSGLSGSYAFAYVPATLDINGGNTWLEAKYRCGTTSADQYWFLCARCQTAPSGATAPANAFIFNGDFNGTGFFQIQQTNGAGAISQLVQNNISPTFTVGNFYRCILTINDTPDGAFAVICGFVQRMVDGFWLQPGGTWAAGAMQSCISYTYVYSFANYTAGWFTTGSFATVGVYQGTGVVGYVDDVIYQDVPFAGQTPASPPAAGAEVELIPSAISASDGGTSGHSSTQVNLSGFSSYYLSTGNQGYVVLDAGVGVTATPTACLWSPAFDFSASAGGNQGLERLMIGATIDGANVSTGPWTSLGAAPTNMYPEPQIQNVVRLDPSNPGGTFRYFRIKAPFLQCAVSQFRMLVQNSGGVSWRPAPPAITPAAGSFAAGQTATVASQTSGASGYYLSGTRTSPPADPTNLTGTLYSGPITPATNAPDETWIKAVAYHASGTTTLSRVVSAHFIIGKEVVADTGVSGNTWFGNGSSDLWPSDKYDSRGVLMQNTSSDLGYDAASTKLWNLGQNVNSGATASTTVINRGFNIYTGSVPAASGYFNWDLAAQIPPVAAGLLWPLGSPPDYQTRAHILVNPNPLNANNKYVCVAHYGAATGFVAIATSPALTGPWKWKSLLKPNATAVGDLNGFYDVVDDGTGHSRNKAWVVFTSTTNTIVRVCQLDPATDWTSFTGSNTTIATATTNSWPGTIEAPVLFNNNGYYFNINSAGTGYGAGTTQEKYGSATTLGGLNSATAASIYSSVPGSTSVAANAQSTAFVQIPGLTATGYIYGSTIQDSGDTGATPNLYWAREAYWPVSTVTGPANQVNAFPSAGVLSLPFPTAWDSTYLPAGTATVQVWPYLDTELCGGFVGMGMGGL